MTDHLSEDQMCLAITGQPAPEALRHLAACLDCRIELERSRGALAAFRLVVTGHAERRAMTGPPPVDHRRSSGISEPRRAWAAAVPASALTMVLAALVWTVPASLPRQPLQRPSGGEWAAGSGTVSDRQAARAAFFPLAYSHLPSTSSRIVRLEVPAEALTAFGLDAAGAASRRPGAVLADVVIGGDGLARGVRFVRAIERDRDIADAPAGARTEEYMP